MKAEELIEYINNGILVNGKKRKFDIVDFYLLSDINEESFVNEIKENISKSHLIKIKSFFSENKGETIIPGDFNYRQIISTKEEVNAKRDNKGFPIPNTGTIITVEDKHAMMNYIMEHNIPLTTKTYKLVRQRFIDGELKFNKINSL